MTGRRQLKRQIQDVLAELGSSRAEAAESLHNSGVHTVPKDPQCCAVAVYLNAVLGADLRVASVLVHSHSVQVLAEGPRWYQLSHLVTVALSPSLRDFIVKDFGVRVSYDVPVRLGQQREDLGELAAPGGMERLKKAPMPARW
jgi:hypothetical protein